MKCGTPGYSDNGTGPATGVCGYWLWRTESAGYASSDTRFLVECARHKSFQWLDDPFLCRVEETRLRGQARLTSLGPAWCPAHAKALP
jgi:hypothetical protein